MRSVRDWSRWAVFCAILAGSAVVAGLSSAEYAERLNVLESQLAGDAENLRLAAEYRQLAIATAAYDRAITFFEKQTARPGAGPHAYLNLAFAYVDKVPVSGTIRQVYLGRDAIKALTRSIERDPTDVAYLVRGLVNLYYDNLIFHRGPKGIADLEEARRLSAAHSRLPYVPRIFISLGDGYWRLKNAIRAREVWGDGLAQFPDQEPLRVRLSSSDDVVRGLVAHTFDPDLRVDTSLREVFPDVPTFGVISAQR